MRAKVALASFTITTLVEVRIPEHLEIFVFTDIFDLARHR